MRRQNLFETLEDRCVLAGDPTIISSNPTLPQTIDSTSSLQFTFSEAVQNADNVANYTVVGAGGDSQFGNGNDVPVTIQSAVYSNGTVTLTFAQPLVPDAYRLTINDDLIVDADGNVFDGDANGAAGGDYVVDFDVAVNANDAPTVSITAPGYTALEQTTLELQGTGITIADVDAGTDTVVATISTSAGGTLSANVGNTGVVANGSGTTSLTLTGTLSQINALLDGNGGTLTYLFDANAVPASDTLTISVNDQSTGTGGALTGQSSTTINLVGVNDAPTVTLTNNTYSATGGSLNLQGTGISVADADVGTGNVQATISVSSGTLSSLAGNTGVTITGSGTNTVKLTGTTAQINTLLSGQAGTLLFLPPGNADTTSTLSVRVSDLGQSGIGGALSTVTNATINLTNNPPVNVQGVVLGFNPITGQWQGTTLPSTGTGTTTILAQWATSAQVGWQDGLTGDFTGDGVVDVVARTADGDIWVGASGANGFTTTYWGWLSPDIDVDLQVANVDADGRADLVGYMTSTGQWWAAVSTGTSFTNTLIAAFSTGVTWTDHLVADFTGDGRADVAARTNEGQWWLGVTNAQPGVITAPDLLGAWATDVTWRDVNAADYNGDGMADIVGRADFANSDASGWWLLQTRLNAPNDYAADSSFLAGWTESIGWTVVIADLNGDNKDEIVGRTTSGDWWIVQNVNATNTSTLLGSWPNVVWNSTLVGDVDGDGADELIGRQANGNWIVSSFPNGAGSQIDTTPASWASNVDWMFTGFGQDDGTLFP